jgi:hypothetical protein
LPSRPSRCSDADRADRLPGLSRPRGLRLPFGASRSALARFRPARAPCGRSRLSWDSPCASPPTLARLVHGVSPPRGLPEPSGKHVPPSWFCTTSTVCHAREVRACCIPLPTLRFAAFRAFPAPPSAEADGSATSAVPATRFTPLEESPRRQPHRVTAAVALLWFHRRTASFPPPKRRDADDGPRPTRWAQIPARSLARRPPHIHRRDSHSRSRVTRVRVVERSPRPARRLRCRSRPSGREGGHSRAFLHRRVRELASPLPVGRSPHSFHGLCPPSRCFWLRAAAPPSRAVHVSNEDLWTPGPGGEPPSTELAFPKENQLASGRFTG